MGRGEEYRKSLASAISDGEGVNWSEAEGAGPQVLALAAAVARERHGVARAACVTPDALLEQDLGLFSLERLELAHRIEAALAVHLDQTALADASSLQDLIDLADGRPAVRRPAPAASSAQPTAVLPDQPARSLTFTFRVAVVLTVLGVLLRVLVLVRPGASQTRRAFRWAARTLLRSAGCDPAIAGLHHLQGRLPAVLVANHQSYADTVVVLAALPFDFVLVANERLRLAPLLGAGIRAARYLIVDRTSSCSRATGASAMVDVLTDEGSLLVFPEGTIETGPRLGSFRLGAFAAAVRTGRPLIPITIEGTRRVLSLDSWLLARVPLSVTVHPAIAPEGPWWSEVLRLCTAARSAIGGHADSPTG